MDDAFTPDVGAVAALVGDRARAAMLTALLAGRPLTATELARAAAVTKQTASAHLGRLQRAGLITADAAGRHRYFSLAGREVAAAIESLAVLARRVGASVRAPGPSDPAMRRARVCYDHLAGELGVLVYDRMREHGWIVPRDRDLVLTDGGTRFCARLGIDMAALEATRRPACLPCLDWSVRRPHLAGAVGAAILEQCLRRGWARRRRGSRALIFPVVGERALLARLR